VSGASTITGNDAAARTAIAPAARLAGLRPYEPPTSLVPIDLALDANEGPAPSEALLAALRELSPEQVRRYPHAEALEERIAAQWGIDAARVVVTNGGDDAIDRLCRAALEPGRVALLHTPTFEMIERSARLAGGEVRSLPWPDGAFPSDEFAQAIVPGVALVSLVSPNNPTGGAIDTSTVLRIAQRARDVGAVVMVDLAYTEFADEDPTAMLLSEPNVVIVRTFSKARGLAGLRVGYAIAPVEIARWLRTVGSPYPVASASLAVAGASLEQGNEAVRQTVCAVRDQRARLTDLLQSLGAQPLVSQANFVTARFKNALFVRRALASLGIAVRGFSPRPTAPGIENLLRITLPGDEASFGTLVGALETAMRPRAILLDMDGVLADVSGSYRAAIVATAASFGVTLSSADIAAAKQAGNANNDWVLTQRLLAARDINVSLESVTQRFQSLYLGTPAAPGLRERESLIPAASVIRELARRLPLAIVTGRPRAEAAWFLERSGLADVCRVRVCMEDAPAKPSPEPVLRALRELDVPSAWMIGDTPDDCVAARRAGVIPLGVLSPGDARDDAPGTIQSLERAGAAAIITALNDLLEMLP
jgi:histidinol-phosphate aminotransferase